MGSWFPSPGDLLNWGTEPRSPALQADSLPSELPGRSSSVILTLRPQFLHPSVRQYFSRKVLWECGRKSSKSKEFITDVCLKYSSWLVVAIQPTLVTLVPVNSISIFGTYQKSLMPSNGERSSCITTICFLGTHSSQLCCQLSSCLLVYHTEKLRMHGLDLLKTEHFCFSLMFSQYLIILTECPTSTYWMTPADPWQQGRLIIVNKLSSVRFSRSVMSNSLRSHGLQHTRLPCPSPTPGACSSSCPLNHLYHPTISSSVIPFSSCLQSCPASGSFPRSQFFAWGGQIIGISASASVLPLGLTVLILQFKGLSRVYSNITVQKHQLFSAQLSLESSSHIHTLLPEKP